MQENAIPSQPDFQALNPDIDFQASKVVVPRRIMAFPPGGRAKPRTVGVSSFGISGTLCHIILQEFISVPVNGTVRSPSLFLINANTSSKSLLSNRLFMLLFQNRSLSKAMERDNLVMR